MKGAWIALGFSLLNCYPHLSTSEIKHRFSRTHRLPSSKTSVIVHRSSRLNLLGGSHELSIRTLYRHDLFTQVQAVNMSQNAGKRVSATRTFGGGSKERSDSTIGGAGGSWYFVGCHLEMRRVVGAGSRMGAPAALVDAPADDMGATVLGDDFRLLSTGAPRSFPG